MSMYVQMKMEVVNTTALIQIVLTTAHVIQDTSYTRKSFVQVITLVCQKAFHLLWVLLI